MNVLFVLKNDKNQKMILPCKHYFHEECIINWAYAEDKIWHTCPICRKKFKFTKNITKCMKKVYYLIQIEKKKNLRLDQVNSGLTISYNSSRWRRNRSNYVYISDRNNYQRSQVRIYANDNVHIPTNTSAGCCIIC